MNKTTILTLKQVKYSKCLFFVSFKLILYFKFLVRQDVLKVYKQLMKNIYKIEDASYRIDLIKWIRSDFKINKNLQDEV